MDVATALLADYVASAKGRHYTDGPAIGGGSSGLRAAARMAYIGGKDPEDDERVVLCCVKNVGEKPKPLAFTLDGIPYEGSDGRSGSAGVLTFAGELEEYDVMQLLGKPSQDKPGRPADKRAFAAEWLAQYLYGRSHHEAPVNEIKEDARQYQITSKTLDRAATDMKVDKAKRKGDDGMQAGWWSLPAELLRQMEQDDDG